MKPKIISIDLETYSDVDLGKCGVYRYVEGDFHILLFAYAFDDEEVSIIDLASGETLPEEVLDAINDPDIIKSAWNAAFERTCIGHMLRRTLAPDDWRCSMVWAASLSLPLALKNAAAALRTGEQKDKVGEKLIRYFSKPCKPTATNGGRTRNLPLHAPEKWALFKEYCLQDVRTERDIRKKLEHFPMPDREWELYHLDQRINDRGVMIDTALVKQAIACDKQLTAEMTEQAKALTGLANPNSISQLKVWLDEQGIKVDTLDKKDVEKLIEAMGDDSSGDNEDNTVKKVLQLRLMMAKSSVKKYEAAERFTCQDQRAHGLFQFNGANRTARFSGRGIQLQNLPQNHIATLEEARELLKAGEFEMLRLIYGNVPDILSQLLRTMLIAKPGHEFIIADFSAIEARLLAWEAGEDWRLRAFAEGADIYCASASQMFGVPVVKHGVNGELRQKGKVAELACIAEGELVLTNRGLVPIEQVTTEMKLWDGKEWVDHEGVVFRGERDVIEYEGLTATPDHLVFTPHGYLPFILYSLGGARPAGKKRVYDIANAGYGQRFMVSDHLVHNCGYGGSVGALKNMGALEMGLKERELPDLISSWRETNPNIVQYWWDVDRAANETFRNGKDHEAGKLTFQYSDNTLWMVLPSGRRLAYCSPKRQPNQFGRMSMTYMGVDAANKWSRIATYGPKLVENCVAEGTLILSQRGLIPIETIRKEDCIWDGEAWVQHDGLIDKGLQDTVVLFSCQSDGKVTQSSGHIPGIHVTYDHRILTDCGWIESGEASGSYWAEVQLPDSVGKSRKLKAGKGSMVMQMRLRKGGCDQLQKLKEQEIPCEVLWLYEGETDKSITDNTRYESSPCVGSMAQYEAEMPRSKTSCLSQLWWTRNHGLRPLVGKFRELLGRYGVYLAGRFGTGSHRQQQRIQPGQLSVDYKANELAESSADQVCKHRRGNDLGGRIGRENRNWGNYIIVPPQPQLANRISIRETGCKEHVYDIRNCGPRHRFTVYDPSAGKLRIVSNCTQAIARDILCEAMLRMEQRGLRIVAHVHDEVIIEAPKGQYSVKDVCDIMNERPSWGRDIPLASAGYKGEPYYYKD